MKRSGVGRGSGGPAGRPSTRPPPTAGKIPPGLLEICPFLRPFSPPKKITTRILLKRLAGFCLELRPLAAAAPAGTEGATAAWPTCAPGLPLLLSVLAPRWWLRCGDPPLHTVLPDGYVLCASESLLEELCTPLRVSPGLAPCPGDRLLSHLGQSELCSLGSDRCRRIPWNRL